MMISGDFVLLFEVAGDACISTPHRVVSGVNHLEGLVNIHPSNKLQELPWKYLRQQFLFKYGN